MVKHLEDRPIDLTVPIVFVKHCRKLISMMSTPLLSNRNSE